jgi:hypothetical protein
MHKWNSTERDSLTDRVMCFIRGKANHA